MTIQTTGALSRAGTQAYGIVLFTNSTSQSVAIPAQLILTTSSGIRFQTTQAVEVPPHHAGEDGKSSVPTQAINPGAAGNIPAHALDGTCCKNGISVTNPAPFSGGTDTQMLHTLSQTDVESAKNMLIAKLQPQLALQLQKKLSNDDIMAVQPMYVVTVSPSSPVGTPIDQVQVAITLQGTVVVYSHKVVNQTIAQLLNREAMKILGNSYHLQGTPSIAAPHIVQQGKGGLIYLNVSAQGLWVYLLSVEQLHQWRQSIKGATSAAALAYLTTQPGVGTVQLRLPLGTDHLPSSEDDINIVQVTIQENS
jgi:hypothetical protein